MRNFAAADSFDCDRLIAVEVVTPGGNWSSYPPHKHDEHRPGVEAELEEILGVEAPADSTAEQTAVAPPSAAPEAPPSTSQTTTSDRPADSTIWRTASSGETSISL